MARIRVEAGQVVVLVEGLARLIASRERVAAPLRSVVNVTVQAATPRNLFEHVKALMSAGTHIPGVIQVGTFFAADGMVFYALRDARRAITIELEGERYRRFIVEPPGDEDPALCAAFIREAAAAARVTPPLDA
jgi:hypothetical protein